MTSDSHGEYWSSFLFRKNDTWQYIFDAPDFTFEFPTNSTRCSKCLHTSKRDLLVCLLDDTFVPSESNTVPYYFPELSSEMGRFNLRVLDFINEPKEKSLLSFQNPRPYEADCSSQDKHSFRSSNWQKNDIDGNNYDDISLELVEVSLCETIDEPQSVDYKSYKILPVSHQLTWLFDGETFTPTPETQVFLDKLEVEQ